MELNQCDDKEEGEKWSDDNFDETTSTFPKGKLVLILIIGFLIGVSAKAQAIKTITMGFKDYRIDRLHDDYIQVKKIKKEGPNITTEKETKQVETDDTAVPAEGDDQDSDDVNLDQ